MDANGIAPAEARATRCSDCAARLAADQRYCLSCGARRGALPGGVSEMIGAMLERGSEPAGPHATDSPDAPYPHPSLPRGPWPLTRLPGPQALAATLLVVLAFGVLAGSLAPAPVAALVRGPLLLLVHKVAPAVVASANDGGSGGDSGSGGGPAQTQQTITVTTPAPATPTPQTPASAPVTTTPSGGPGQGSSTSPSLLGLPPIKHVFLIVLANQGFSQTFDPVGGDHYLSHALPKQGELVEDYYGVTGSSLANGAALISGQGPTRMTDVNCPTYSAIAHSFTGPEGQVIGSGCAYPQSTQTIADQLTSKGLAWRAYIDGIDGAAAKPKSCRHPALGAADPNYGLRPRDPYLTWRNPFVYFGSLTSRPTCAKDDVGLEQLTKDLKQLSSTPSLSYIVPSPCEDGDSTPCRTGAPAGLAPADAFLRRILPKIQRSRAFKADGLIAVTFDHAPQGGPHADSNACCSTPPYPDLPSSTSSGTTTTPTGTTSTPTMTTPTTTPTGTTSTPTTTTPTTTPAGTTTPPPPPNPGDVPGQTIPTGGGGQVGLVLLSAYVKKGSVESIDYYNHFSLLGTIESLFGLKRLGFAGDRALSLFDTIIFNRHP